MIWIKTANKYIIIVYCNIGTIDIYLKKIKQSSYFEIFIMIYIQQFY